MKIKNYPLIHKSQMEGAALVALLTAGYHFTKKRMTANATRAQNAPKSRADPAGPRIYDVSRTQTVDREVRDLAAYKSNLDAYDPATGRQITPSNRIIQNDTQAGPGGWKPWTESDGSSGLLQNWDTTTNPLTGQAFDPTHINMLPFYRGSEPMPVTDNTSRLERYTGTGPGAGTGRVGVENPTPMYGDRVITGAEVDLTRTELRATFATMGGDDQFAPLPQELVRSPMNFDRFLPKTINETRVVDNPKPTYQGVTQAGSLPVARAPDPNVAAPLVQRTFAGLSPMPTMVGGGAEGLGFRDLNVAPVRELPATTVTQNTYRAPGGASVSQTSNRSKETLSKFKHNTTVRNSYTAPGMATVAQVPRRPGSHALKDPKGADAPARFGSASVVVAATTSRANIVVKDPKRDIKAPQRWGDAYIGLGFAQRDQARAKDILKRVHVPGDRGLPQGQIAQPSREAHPTKVHSKIVQSSGTLGHGAPRKGLTPKENGQFTRDHDTTDTRVNTTGLPVGAPASRVTGSATRPFTGFDGEVSHFTPATGLSAPSVMGTSQRVGRNLATVEDHVNSGQRFVSAFEDNKGEVLNFRTELDGNPDRLGTLERGALEGGLFGGVAATETREHKAPDLGRFGAPEAMVQSGDTLRTFSSRPGPEMYQSVADRLDIQIPERVDSRLTPRS